MHKFGKQILRRIIPTQFRFESMPQLQLPNMLIVGAQRCGTTSLHAMLKEHREVTMSQRKETRFFIKERVKEWPDTVHNTKVKNASCLTLGEYVKQFRGGRGRIRGEASPQYLLYHSECVPRIKFLLEDPYIVISLRNPIDRAFSAYRLLTDRGLTELSLDKLLQSELSDPEHPSLPAFQIVQAGMYHEAVKHFLESFSKVRIFLLDDLTADPVAVAQTMYTDLNIECGFIPNNVRESHNAITKTQVSNNYDELRKHLRDIYTDDIKKTSRLIQRDLSHWHS